MDVSVVIAAYNVGPYIRHAIESALSQEGVTVEVIVVDDRSSDDTLAQARSVVDTRVTCIEMPANGGPGAARNAGFTVAKGAWIAVLDGDDIFLPGRLARCIARAKEINADIVVDNQRVHPEGGGAERPMYPLRRFGALGRLTLAKFIRAKLSVLGGHPLGYLKPIFSAAFLRQHGLQYETQIRIGEDYLMLASALARGAVCAVEPTMGYRYTVRKGSISHRIDPAGVRRMLEADKAFLAQHTLDAAAQKEQNMRSFLLHEMLAYAMLIEALKQRSPSGVLKALVTCPTALRHLWEPVFVRLKRLVVR